MSSFVLPGFGSMRGFGIPSVPSGFCGGFAILGVNTHRPSVRNAGYSLSQLGAAKLFRLARAHGYCATNGAMTITGAYHLLSAIASGQHTLVTSFNEAAYHNACRGILTRRTGIITLWANGQAFPGDEQGLHYHFSGIGGIDTELSVEELRGGYAHCDDDWAGNVYPAAKNAPVWRTYPTMLKAEPVAYIICAH